MKAVRANAEGLSTSLSTSVGVLPTGIEPVTTSFPGVGSVMVSDVVPDFATVVT